MDSLTIAPRFMGPAGSGNGGYVAGRLASYVGSLGDPVTVSLRRPPPLARDLRVEVESGTARLLDGDALVAEARAGALDEPAVEPVTIDEARAAEAAYRGLVDHPFPTCFVCGTGRMPGDGLCLRPGLVAVGRTACTWVPDPTLLDADGLLAPQYVWSALDCPGGWTSDLDSRPLVLGTMTAVCNDLPAVGRPCVVVGRQRAEKGRKTLTSTALYDESGRLLARAEHVWIAVDPAVFQQLSGAT